MRLPEAYRSLPRLSSAPSAKAFSLCSFLLDQFNSFRNPSDATSKMLRIFFGGRSRQINLLLCTVANASIFNLPPANLLTSERLHSLECSVVAIQRATFVTLFESIVSRLTLYCFTCIQFSRCMSYAIRSRDRLDILARQNPIVNNFFQIFANSFFKNTEAAVLFSDILCYNHMKSGKMAGW